MTVSALMMSAPAFAQLEVPQKWDAEYDIVIVGGGVAGLSAAAVAADEKLSAVLFEKQSFLGGSSVLNGGMFTVAGTKEQEKQGIKDSQDLFTGNTGCGKTFLSNCIARELIRRYYSVVYLTATDMFDILAGSRFNGNDDDEAKDRAAYILDCDLLIIDDLGTELINTFTASQMFYCVNERLNRNKGTIISTNLTLGELQDAFTERVTSRIMSKYKIIPLIGDDLRLVRRGFVRRG